MADDYVRLDTELDTASPRAITFNLITSGLGSAIFSLPWCVAGCSILPGLAIIFVVLFLNAWTISILVHAADRYGEFDLGSLIGRLPCGLGKPLQALTNVFLWFSMFLCLVSYIIAIYDSAHKIQEIDRRWLVAYASLGVFPLCLLDQRRLEIFSVAAVVINLYILVVIAELLAQGTTTAGDDEMDHEDTCLVGWTERGMFATSSIVFQAVIIQMVVLPMYKELRNRTPALMDRIVAVAFLSLFFLFAGFSIVGYLYVGPKVKSNILVDLPSFPSTNLAQVSTVVVCACVYPFMVIPMVATFTHDPNGYAGIAVKLCIIACAGAFAAIPDLHLDHVNTINGAMSAALFVGVLPSAVGYFLLRGGPFQQVRLLFLVVVGLALALAGLLYRDNYLNELQCFRYVHS